MKRALFTAILVSFFIGTTVLSSLASDEHESNHHGMMQPAAASSHRMMGQHEMDQMPCMADQASGSMSNKMGMMGNGMGDMMDSGMGDMMDSGMGHMMGAGKMGMMGHRMAQMFYLDRADELGLSTDQVGKLKALHSECRKDNIRNVAEANIARLELADLLDSDSWSLKDAETLIRKTQNLEGDIQIRHLQGISEARKVLTVDQLKQAR